MDVKQVVNVKHGAFGPGGEFEGKENVLVLGVGRDFEHYAKPLMIMATKPQNEYLVLVGSFKTLMLMDYIMRKVDLIGYEPFGDSRKYVKNTLPDGRVVTAIHQYLRRVPLLRHKAESMLK